MTLPATQETARMLRDIEVTLVPGPGRDRAVMPDGTVLEGRGEEELARSVMDHLVPGILEGFAPPTGYHDVHGSVTCIEEELLQKFVDRFLSVARPATTTIHESSAFALMAADVWGRIDRFEEDWYLWRDEMDEAGYDPDQFPIPLEIRYLDDLAFEIVGEADRRSYDPRQLTFLPGERSTGGWRW